MIFNGPKDVLKTNHFIEYNERLHLLNEAKMYVKCLNNVSLKIEFDELRNREGFVQGRWRELQYKCVITATGDIYPCCHKIELKFLLGSLFEESFKDIWNSQKHKILWSVYLERNQACSTCNDSNDSKLINKIISNINI